MKFEDYVNRMNAQALDMTEFVLVTDMNGDSLPWVVLDWVITEDGTIHIISDPYLIEGRYVGMTTHPRFGELPEVELWNHEEIVRRKNHEYGEGRTGNGEEE